jgi:hypothetical protein
MIKSTLSWDRDGKPWVLQKKIARLPNSSFFFVNVAGLP